MTGLPSRMDMEHEPKSGLSIWSREKREWIPLEGRFPWNSEKKNATLKWITPFATDCVSVVIGVLCSLAVLLIGSVSIKLIIKVWTS